MSRIALFLLAGSLAVGCTKSDRFDDKSAKGSADKARPAYLPDVKQDGATAAVAAATAAATPLEAKFDELVRRLRDAQQLPPAAPKAELSYAVPVGANDPTQGPATAPVTIVEAFEFMCPYCAKADPTIEALKAKYGDKLRVVSKYLVIHGEQAVPPALYACAAAKQGKYAEYKKLLWATLFDPQLKMQRDKYTVETFDTLATQVGLDAAKVKADVGMGVDGKLGDSPCLNWIKDSIGSLDAFNISATPAFFINGRFLGGAYPQPAFEKLIDEELAKATTKINGGVPAADFYNSEIVAKGETQVIDILLPRN